MHADLQQIAQDMAALLMPPSELKVWESAAQNIELKVPGGYHGAWLNDRPHYMMEPASILTSRYYRGCIFVGPAQCAKTAALVDNFIAHVITEDPQDILVFQTTEDQAKDFSRRRIDRMLKASPKVGKHLGTSGSDDNVHTKQFKSGMILSLSWPSKTKVAGIAAGIGIATDYDRASDNIGGEGSLFELLENRAKTFGTRAMTVAESSPARHITNKAWKPSTPHEAPPCGGILGLYNTGDRRRAYCQCQHCDEYFMPVHGPEAMRIPEKGDGPADRAARSGLICLSCGAINDMDTQRAIKKSVVWLKEGQTITSDGVIHGQGRQSVRASFWLPGWFAAFEQWDTLITKYLLAMEQYELSKDDKPLQTIYNTGFGTQFIPMAARSERSATQMQEQAAAHSDARERGMVPEWARYLTATVDNQKNSIEILVVAHSVNKELAVVDRYSATVSERVDDRGRPVSMEAAAHWKDLKIIERDLLDGEFATESGRKLSIKSVAMDMHGVKGLSQSAYEFYRYLRKQGKAARFHLVRGTGGNDNTQLIVESFPESKGKGSKLKALSAGDIPVLTLASNRWKDILSVELGIKPGAEGFVHLPAWGGDSLFEEIVAEVRGLKGWEKISARNEMLDLLYYSIALRSHIGGDKIDWSRPPLWAEELDKNSNVVGSSKAEKSGLDFFTEESYTEEDQWL